MLLKRLAAEDGSRGTRLAGADDVERFAQSVGTSSPGGRRLRPLAAQRRSPARDRQAARGDVRRPIRTGPHSAASLPIAGREGTVADRMRGTAAEGRCATKTGTLDGVSALSGYCNARHGHTIAFSVLNNSSTSTPPTPPRTGSRPRSPATGPSPDGKTRPRSWPRLARRVDAHANMCSCARQPPPSILHADADAFFASVEQRDDPAFARAGRWSVGKRRRHGGELRGRAFGIRGAMGGGRARRLCPDLVAVPPRFDAYVEASGRCSTSFAATAPVVEGLSMEEAFLDVSGLERISARRRRSRRGCAPGARARSDSGLGRRSRARRRWRRWPVGPRSPTGCSSSPPDASAPSWIRCRSRACGGSGPRPRGRCTGSGCGTRRARSRRCPSRRCDCRRRATRPTHLHAVAL